MLRIAVLVSGGGTNLQAIMDAIDAGEIRNTQIAAVISNNAGAYALERAKNHGIEALCISPKDYGTRDAFNKAFLEKLDDCQPDLIVLAGYMRVLPEDVLELGKFVNIHPSLLPAFKGKDAIQRAFNAGVKVSGVTVHHVTNELDGGKIIAQYPVLIPNLMHYDEFEAEIHRVEHALYPKVIECILEDKVFDFSDLYDGDSCGGCSGGGCGGCH